MRLAGVPRNVIKYTAVIDACARIDEAAQAEEWLLEMQEEGLQPDVISYNAVSDARRD